MWSEPGYTVIHVSTLLYQPFLTMINYYSSWSTTVHQSIWQQCLVQRKAQPRLPCWWRIATITWWTLQPQGIWGTNTWGCSNKWLQVKGPVGTPGCEPVPSMISYYRWTVGMGLLLQFFGWFNPWPSRSTKITRHRVMVITNKLLRKHDE